VSRAKRKNTKRTHLYREPDQAELQALWLLVRRFVEEQRITCPESVSQQDNVIVAAYGLIEAACDIVGYLDTE
jgi:hypothetical protein